MHQRREELATVDGNFVSPPGWQADGDMGTRLFQGLLTFNRSFHAVRTITPYGGAAHEPTPIEVGITDVLHAKSIGTL